MANLHAPFASQADTLQTNCLSLSFVLPYAQLLTDLLDRFSSLLNPQAGGFNPLTAATSLLDPTVAPVLFAYDNQQLITAAKLYLIYEFNSRKNE